MERLTTLVLAAAWALAACAPAGRDDYRRLDTAFSAVPFDVSRSATGFWRTEYREDPTAGTFRRRLSEAQIPEKMTADGHGGWTVELPLLVQSETQEGPEPDSWETLVVRVQRVEERWTLVPTAGLPGTLALWDDQGHRTLRIRGILDDGPGNRVLWQFHGRY